MIGAKSSNTLVAVIYRKLSKVSPSTNKEFDSGQIVNFVQVDAMQAFWMCFQLADILTMPILMTFAFVFLFYFLGLTFFSGIGVFVVAFISSTIVGGFVNKFNKAKMKKTDERMNFTNEAFSNIKTLKFYSWLDFFEKAIDKRRNQELKQIKYYFYGAVFFISSLYFFPSILSSVVMSTFIGTGHTIDLPTTFTILVLLDMIREPIRQLPYFLTSFI